MIAELTVLLCAVTSHTAMWAPMNLNWIVILVIAIIVALIALGAGLYSLYTYFSAFVDEEAEEEDSFNGTIPTY